MVLPVLSKKDSIHLLKIICPKIVLDFNEQAQELVEHLEGLPLAIQVAGKLLSAELSYGWGIDNLLADLKTTTRLLQENIPIELKNLSTQTSLSVAALLKKNNVVIATDHLVAGSVAEAAELALGGNVDPVVLRVAELLA